MSLCISKERENRGERGREGEREMDLVVRLELILWTRLFCDGERGREVRKSTLIRVVPKVAL